MAFLENAGLERVWGHIVHRLSLKIDKSEIATDEEALEFIMNTGYVNPLVTDSNVIYTNGDNKIYTL